MVPKSSWTSGNVFCWSGIGFLSCFFSSSALSCSASSLSSYSYRFLVVSLCFYCSSAITQALSISSSINCLKYAMCSFSLWALSIGVAWPFEPDELVFAPFVRFYVEPLLFFFFLFFVYGFDWVSAAWKVIDDLVPLASSSCISAGFLIISTDWEAVSWKIFAAPLPIICSLLAD